MVIVVVVVGGGGSGSVVTLDATPARERLPAHAAAGVEGGWQAQQGVGEGRTGHGEINT